MLGAAAKWYGNILTVDAVHVQEETLLLLVKPATILMILEMNIIL